MRPPRGPAGTSPTSLGATRNTGAARHDLDKVVRTPELEIGENIEIQTRPDLETYQSENDAPVGLRANGRDFEYPILPGEGDPEP